MGFPYIFRGALDVRAREINEEMKVAAAEAIAPTRPRRRAGGSDRRLCRRKMNTGRNISSHAVRSAPHHHHRRRRRARGDGIGVARKPITDFERISASAAPPRPHRQRMAHTFSTQVRTTRSASSSPRARRKKSSAPPSNGATTATATRSWSAAPSASARPSTASASSRLIAGDRQRRRHEASRQLHGLSLPSCSARAS